MTSATELARQAEACETPLPDRQYGVILADPPWTFKTRSEKGLGKSPQRHYKCLSTEEICAFPFARLPADDCALFLWATWPKIFDAKKVIEAWGFEYSGLAWEWIKYNSETGKYAFGGGYGTRKNVEPCLLARKGSPKRLSASERDFIFARQRESGRKPDEQYGKIERLFAGPYIELFARQPWPGWTAWGDETSKFAEATP